VSFTLVIVWAQMTWINKTTLVGVGFLLLATGCGKQTETPATDLSAPGLPVLVKDYIETGDLATLKKTRLSAVPAAAAG